MPPTNTSPVPDYATYLTASLYLIILAANFKKVTWFMVSLSLGIGCLVYAIEQPISVAAGIAAIVLLIMTSTMNNTDGFNTRTPPRDIANQISSEKRKYKLSKTIEGYEDVKTEKNEKPAPVKEESKDNMAIPFKLGEVPSQVKNGPHLDASSTLMKALKSLDPDQINAMSKDTQQLIETQKSLMNMMGTMKPMLNDGKELMDTFQQMFGK